MVLQYDRQTFDVVDSAKIGGQAAQISVLEPGVVQEDRNVAPAGIQRQESRSASWHRRTENIRIRV